MKRSDIIQGKLYSALKSGAALRLRAPLSVVQALIKKATDD